jgi:hypothetical protein
MAKEPITSDCPCAYCHHSKTCVEECINFDRYFSTRNDNRRMKLLNDFLKLQDLANEQQTKTSYQK